MKKKTQSIIKKLSLEDKVDLLNHLLWSENTNFFIYSDKRECGFDVPINHKSKYPSRDACLNGLSIQINLDLDKAELTSFHSKLKIKRPNKVKLNSFKLLEDKCLN
tara:strand:- start:261 stop:578 length:318 start_codon:yes stop_codon:yes gene_type:complete